MEMSDVFTNQKVLVPHANARLNLHGRRLLVSRVIDDARPVAHVAKALGVSRQCAHRWVARFRLEGDAGLIARSSRPRRCPRRTPLDVEKRVLRTPRSVKMRGPLIEPPGHDVTVAAALQGGSRTAIDSCVVVSPRRARRMPLAGAARWWMSAGTGSSDRCE